MATYNGSKYIEKQLYSFCDQTIKPNELIICDDKSEDNTVYIIEKFVENAPFQVKLFQNEIRMVGNNQKKGILTLKYLAKKYSDIQFYVFGDNSIELGESKTVDNIIYLGWLDTLNYFRTNIDLVVFPSVIEEAFGCN
jgi:glycosyltransferase involved in cell wall biosynthesis